MWGSLLFTLASSLTPPSLSSSLLQPSLCCISSRGDPEDRSEACSSHSVTHLVNCFPSSSLPYCTTTRICTILLWDAILYEKPFSCFWRHSWFIWKGDSCFLNFLPIIPVWYFDPVIIPLWLPLYVSIGVARIGLLLCLHCQSLEKGALYQI